MLTICVFAIQNCCRYRPERHLAGELRSHLQLKRVRIQEDVRQPGQQPAPEAGHHEKCRPSHVRPGRVCQQVDRHHGDGHDTQRMTEERQRCQQSTPREQRRPPGVVSALVSDHACEGQDEAEAVHPGETCAIHHPDGDRAQRGASRRRPGPSLSSRKGVDTDHDEDAADQRERSRLHESDTDDAKPCG